MNKVLLIGGGLFAAFVVLALITVFWVFSIFNGEVRLKNTYLAKKKHIETAHDTMWKTISQKYKISEDYRETFISGLKAVAQGREGGSLFKMNTESNSQLGLSTDVFNSMMATIEGQRSILKREQDTLADMWRAHCTFCKIYPNVFIIGDKVMPEPIMITSSKTQNAVETGKDDDIKMGE